MRIKRNTKDLARFLNDWLRVYLPSVKFRSLNTIDTYETSLSLYLDFIERQKGIRPSTLSEDAFKKDWIEEWLSYLRTECKNSKQTCDLRLSSMRSLLKYLSSRNSLYLQYYHEACEIGKMARGHGTKVEGLTKKAMTVLFSVMGKRDKTEFRDKVLFTIMYDTGARVGEILGIKLRDIFLECKTPYVIINGKGNKRRILVLSPETVAILNEYIKDILGGFAHNDICLFFSRVNGKRKSLNEDTVNVRLKKYAAKAHEICKEVPTSMHTHQIRHSACTHWFQDGINLAVISRYLGHESLDTTRIYLGISKEELTEALAKRENVIKDDSSIYKNVKGGLRSLLTTKDR